MKFYGVKPAVATDTGPTVTSSVAACDDALGLLANCADIYARCDDANRHLCNQVFFTKVYIVEDNELCVEHNRPFGMLLDPRSTPTP